MAWASSYRQPGYLLSLGHDSEHLEKKPKFSQLVPLRSASSYFPLHDSHFLGTIGLSELIAFLSLCIQRSHFPKLWNMTPSAGLHNSVLMFWNFDFPGSPFKFKWYGSTLFRLFDCNRTISCAYNGLLLIPIKKNYQCCRFRKKKSSSNLPACTRSEMFIDLEFTSCLKEKKERVATPTLSQLA